MDQKVTITIKNLQNKIPISPERIKQIILKTLEAEAAAVKPVRNPVLRGAISNGTKKSILINVCFTGDRKIKELNRKYLKKNSPTDVLAFDMSSPARRGRICADIVVSAETAARNAGIFKTRPVYEAELCLLHGVLHILGYRDNNLKGRKLMQDKAEQALSLKWPSRKLKR